tara:strand:+ start:92536 stop:93267 length:732 start_codon:yes stop_codon:yes gene_type:complete
MKNFYFNLASLYESSGMSIEENRGRRNIMMSAPMEYFLAQELRKTFPKVDDDGRTGKADIIISFRKGFEKELECKLTSPHSSGSISFQTDYETLEKKGSLDYIYIIANEDFSGFCAIHFKDLDISDFRNLSPGARGKVQMFKHKGMLKGNVLLGNVVNLNERRAESIMEKMENQKSLIQSQINIWKEQRASLKNTQVYDYNKYTDQINRSTQKLENLINKTEEEIKIISERKSRYTFEYEEIK